MQNRVPVLDGFRGLAVLIVVVSHVLTFDFRLPTVDLGGIGVIAFFVLSGYLITGLLDREREATQSLALGRFYARRALRLFPVFYLFLAVLCVLALAHVIDDTSRETIVACALYYRNLAGDGFMTGHIWTLSMEEQFYLIWPLAILLLRPRRALQLAVTGIIAINAFRMIAIYYDLWPWETGVFYVRPWFRFDELLAGCALWLWLHHYRPRVPDWLKSGLVPLLGWPAAIVWITFFQQIAMEIYIPVALVLTVLLLLNLVQTESRPVIALFSHPVARWFGRISYSWYLWQQLFLVYAPPQEPRGLRAFPISVVASLVVAAASYYGVERTFLKLRDRMTAERSTPAMAGSL